MKPARRKSTKALQLYTPDAATLYTLEAAERLGRVPRRMIIVY